MEIICLGFLLGVVFSIITFGAGVFYCERVDKRKHYDDSDMHIYVPSRGRSGCSNSRYVEQMDGQASAEQLRRKGENDER